MQREDTEYETYNRRSLRTAAVGRIIVKVKKENIAGIILWALRFVSSHTEINQREESIATVQVEVLIDNLATNGRAYPRLVTKGLGDCGVSFFSL